MQFPTPHFPTPHQGEFVGASRLPAIFPLRTMHSLDFLFLLRQGKRKCNICPQVTAPAAPAQKTPRPAPLAPNHCRFTTATGQQSLAQSCPPTDRQSLTQSHTTPPSTKNNPKEKIPKNLALSKPLRFFVPSNIQQGKHNNITTNTARQPTR
jgi:hypothetical protein